MAWIVEEVALDAPDFVVHLVPFDARIDVDLHRGSFQRAITGFGGRSRRGDEPVLGPGDTELFRRSPRQRIH